MCFRTRTIDISVGGACITHENVLKVGDRIELRTKNCLTNSRCLSCNDVLFMLCKIELQPIEAEVVWVADKRAGIHFHNLSARNENILNKLVWEHHLDKVRKERV